MRLLIEVCAFLFTLKSFIESSLVIESKESSNLNAIGESIAEIFSKRSGITLFIGDWSRSCSLVLKPSFTQLTSIVLLGANEDSALKKYKRYANVYKINETHVKHKSYPTVNVGLVASSNEALGMVLDDLRNSVWWNHEANFFLINLFRNGCEFAQPFLNTVWNHNILSAVYLCRKPNKKLTLYSFNPYNSIAPKFWNVIRNSNMSNPHWSLLEHHLNEFASQLFVILSDENLYFDKTKNLNRSIIKFVVCHPPDLPLKYNISNTGYVRDRLATHGIINLILNHINAVSIRKVSKNCGFIDEDLNPQGLLKDIAQCDFVGNALLLHNFWTTQTYPHTATKIVIVTMNDKANCVDKLAKIFTVKVWLLCFLIFIITVVTLKMLLQLSIGQAVLESLRVFTNSSTIKNPRYLSERIFFIFLLYVIFVMNTSMLSRLTEINTISETQFVDSPDDLIKSNLSVYGPVHLKELITHKELRARYTISPIRRCIRLLLDGNKIACIYSNDVLRFFVYENRFVHVSKQALFASSLSFKCSKDWPLLRKINWILSRLSSGGFITLFYTRQERYYIKDPDMYNYTKEARPLDTRKLKISLSMLVVGWILGFLALLLENIAHLVLRLYNKKSVKV